MRTTSLKRQMEFLSKRKAELGVTGRSYVARNSGTARTASKKALLEELADKAKERGEAPRFQDSFRP